MNILLSVKKLIRRIKLAEKRAQSLYKKQEYTSNPFDYIPSRTYVWIEKVEDFNHCKYNCPCKNKNKKNS